jgi:hypothetical protein
MKKQRAKKTFRKNFSERSCKLFAGTYWCKPDADSKINAWRTEARDELP